MKLLPLINNRTISFFAFPSLFFLFWLFFKIGLVFIGGGYVVIPVLHRELVTNLHLLTEQEFIDGAAISQLTPGPIAIIATFVGYKIAGVFGALISTFAMFLPGMSLMLLLSKSYEKIQNSDYARKILKTILPTIVGLLIAASFQIGKSTITNPLDWVILIISFILIIRFKINPAILIITSALFGWVFIK